MMTVKQRVPRPLAGRWRLALVAASFALLAATPARAGSYQLVRHTGTGSIHYSGNSPETLTLNEGDPFENGDMGLAGTLPGQTMTYQFTDRYEYRWVPNTITVGGEEVPDPNDLPRDQYLVAAADVSWVCSENGTPQVACTTTASASAGATGYEVTFGSESDGMGGYTLFHPDPGNAVVYKTLRLTGLLPTVEVTFAASMTMGAVPPGADYPYFSYMELMRRRPAGKFIWFTAPENNARFRTNPFIQGDKATVTFQGEFRFPPGHVGPFRARVESRYVGSQIGFSEVGTQELIVPPPTWQVTGEFSSHQSQIHIRVTLQKLVSGQWVTVQNDPAWQDQIAIFVD
jgi:hypothetical protein